MSPLLQADGGWRSAGPVARMTPCLCGGCRMGTRAKTRMCIRIWGSRLDAGRGTVDLICLLGLLQWRPWNLRRLRSGSSVHSRLTCLSPGWDSVWTCDCVSVPGLGVWWAHDECGSHGGWEVISEWSVTEEWAATMPISWLEWCCSQGPWQGCWARGAAVFAAEDVGAMPGAGLGDFRKHTRERIWRNL